MVPLFVPPPTLIVLIDGAGQARTTSVRLAPFTVFGNDVLQIPIEFPVPSFF